MMKVIFLLLIQTVIVNQGFAQKFNPVIKQDIIINSEGVNLAGTIYKPKNAYASVVVVHGSGQETRMTEFAELLANNGISVLTYDKRGVGKSGGVYAGPEVGTNNVDSLNINLLAKDALAALNKIKNYSNGTPIGLLGFSQAGWIIPIAANNNPLVNFMVLFSCPTITSLEQLRFQFYTNGNTDFWVNHTEEDTRNHIKNDSDRYQFISTDPKVALRNISAPSLWLFGEKDIQIPVKLCIEQINTLKSEGKPFEYTLFSNLGHNTAFTDDKSPVENAINWIKEKTKNFKP
ncbi:MULTISPECIES: alpha/beta hydrolase family protein [Aquirufa]|jgi:dienelactone hydrolase|uniref:alpha/beta hydrolase family protein n=1 Tax=Aquirufa TaxID=2676247 RepID=UPI00208E2DD0|nr:alpha/beta hydrolase [Aquirufa antheringensis]